MNKYLIRRIVLGSIALFLILQAFNFMGHLPLFKIREIEVAGNQFLSKDDVLQNLEIPADASWLWISGTKIFRKLKTLPQIKECQIKKKFPGKILVLIQEYKPLFRVHMGAQDWIFAGDGKILNSEQLKPESLAFLPELTGVKKFDDLKAILPDVQYFLEQLSHFAQAQTIQFDASDKLNWEMLWNQKLLIKIGDTSELSEKVRVLKGLYPLILSKASQMQYIDLRAPQNAVVRYR